MQVTPESQTILAFDFGQRRIGVACGQTFTGTANPLTTVQHLANQPDWQAIRQLLAEWQPQQLVVGLPIRHDGSDSPITKAARAFAHELQQRSELPVSLHNETLSSNAASEVLREQRQSGQRKKRLQKEDIDQIAATLILQSWLEENKK